MCRKALEAKSNHPNCSYCIWKTTTALSRDIMSFQKKNVILGFVKDDYIPSAEQLLVKYTAGKGNNLHEVECVDGRKLLVSMPKKYRHTVWLKKEDCLVIDPIEEGKKVTGEIVCLLPCDTVRDLIVNHHWPIPPTELETDGLLKFFTRASEEKAKREEFDAFPSTDSSDMETDEDEKQEGEEEDDEEEEDEGEEDTGESDTTKQNSDCTNKPVDEDAEDTHSNNISEDVDDFTRDRNRSRVQLVTSGVVTVTNVLTEGLDNEMQSLEFGADDEEESDELAGRDGRDLQRHANTIRIQVNYNKEN